MARNLPPDLARSAIQRGALRRHRTYRLSLLPSLPDARNASDVRGDDRHRRVVGFRGLNRVEAAWSAVEVISRPNAERDAEVESRQGYVEAAFCDPVPARLQRRHRSGTALRFDRAISSIERIFLAKSYWLGSTAIRLDGSARSRPLRARA